MLNIFAHLGSDALNRGAEWETLRRRYGQGGDERATDPDDTTTVVSFNTNIGEGRAMRAGSGNPTQRRFNTAAALPPQPDPRR